MRVAEAGITELHKCVDTLLIIPNQNLFRVANEKTTFADAFAMADQVLYSGVACITDLMVKEGLINLDFADVRAVMREMGKAMMGTGEASGEKRALTAAEAAISNPLIDDSSMKGARGLLISITGGKDLTLYEVDEAATRIREEVDQDANIIVGATFDESLEGIIRVSVVATGIDTASASARPAATIAPPRRPGSRGQNCGHTPIGAEPAVARHAATGRTHRGGKSDAGAGRGLCAYLDRSYCRKLPGGADGRSADSADAHYGDGGGHLPADPAEAIAVPGTGRGAPGAAGAAGRQDLHPAAAGTARDARAAHAADRGTADPGAERNPRQARRSSPKPRRTSGRCRCCSASPRSASAAAPSRRRAATEAPAPGCAPGPARRRSASAVAGASPRARIARSRARVGICQAVGAATSGASGLSTSHGRPAPVAAPLDDDQLEIPAFLRRQAN